MEKNSKNTLKIEGNIDNLHINGVVSIEKVTQSSNTAKKIMKPIGWLSLSLKILLPFFILALIFFIFRFFSNAANYWIIVLMPILYGWIFYNFSAYSTPENFNYLKKLTDMVTLLASLVAAALILLKIFNMNSSIAEYLVYINKKELEGNIDITLSIGQSLFLFMLLETFSAFATIKFLFSVKDFLEARRAVKGK